MPDIPQKPIIPLAGLRARARELMDALAAHSRKGAGTSSQNRPGGRGTRRQSVRTARPFRRQMMKALAELLAESDIRPGSELFVVKQANGILITVSPDLPSMPETTPRAPSFEESLAEVLAKRESALRRLAQ